MPACVDRAPERLDDLRRQIAQAGIHDRRVLALEQSDAADLARQRDVRRRQRVAEDRAGPLLEVVADGGEHRGDRDGVDALGL